MGAQTKRTSRRKVEKNKKACNRSRTGDLLLTRQVLYQLSYTGYPIFTPSGNINYLLSSHFLPLFFYHYPYSKKLSKMGVWMVWRYHLSLLIEMEI